MKFFCWLHVFSQMVKGNTAQRVRLFVSIAGGKKNHSGDIPLFTLLSGNLNSSLLNALSSSDFWTLLCMRVILCFLVLVNVRA